MGRPSLSFEVLRETAAAYTDARGVEMQAAITLGICLGALQYRLRKIQFEYPELLVGGVSSDVPNEAAAPPPPTATPDPPDVMRVHRAELARKGAEATTAQLKTRVVELETKLATVMALRNTVVEPMPWPSAAPAVHSPTVLMPCIMMSDFQTGEVIRAGELDGMNEYNTDIFRERYCAVIDKAIEWADHHVGRAEFPGFMYWQLGDVISGNLHDDLMATDDLPSVPACRAVFQAEREGIRRLADRFGRVHVVRINGNHDRTTHKPRSKNQAGLSFGTMLSWWLQTAFEGDHRVTWHVPSSPDALVRVFNFNVLLSHGDRMGSKGGGGFIGTEAAIIRGHHQLFKNWSDSGIVPDLICTGHFHTSLRTVRGYGNGATAGYSQFARDLRAIPAAASQQMLFMHEKHKVAHDPVLWLSARPKRTMLDYAA